MKEANWLMVGVFALLLVYCVTGGTVAAYYVGTSEVKNAEYIWQGSKPDSPGMFYFFNFEFFFNTKFRT